MASNILDEIVERRKADINIRGWNLGYEIPECRQREIVPFVGNKTVILEVKRASPSKGDISPDLNAGETAEKYIEAGCGAISVLTEENYFKGSLKDLIEVCKVAGNRCSVLRKDFLIDEKEIEIAYRCGADAVLLIARILDENKFVSMAKKCEELGITAFIELRLQEDLEKLEKVCKVVEPKYIVCGVNSRDLKDFSIDLLTPCMMKKRIQKIAGENVRIVFESGIRTGSAAEFPGGSGFTGLLLGEAAARDVTKAKDFVKSFIESEETDNIRFWNEYAQKIDNKNGKPFVKICGITNEEDALCAVEKGADFIGTILCARSSRFVKEENICSIHESLCKKGKRDSVKICAVVTETDSKEFECALKLYDEKIINVIQLHGKNAYDILISNKNEELKNRLRSIPHYAVVSVEKQEDIEDFDLLRKQGEVRVLIDSKIGTSVGGNGKPVDEEIIKAVCKKNKLWLAGGINCENAGKIISTYKPELIDICTGVEDSLIKGKKDIEKLNKFFEEIK